VRRCRLVRIAHAEINDVLSASTRGLLQFTDDIEDVGRETLNALKMGIHDVDARLKCRLIQPYQGNQIVRRAVAGHHKA
jgi:hypothetical protein